MKDFEPTNHLILHVLGNALIEIRATSNLKKANILADIFHNAPNMIAHGSSPEEIYSEILLVARRRDCEEIIRGHFTAAFAQNANE